MFVVKASRRGNQKSNLEQKTEALILFFQVHVPNVGNS
jgi:hypothetical protein